MVSVLTHSYSLLGHSREVNDLQWSRDSKILVSCSMDGTAIVWKMDTE